MRYAVYRIMNKEFYWHYNSANKIWNGSCAAIDNRDINAIGPFDDFLSVCTRVTLACAPLIDKHSHSNSRVITTSARRFVENQRRFDG